MLFGVTGLDYSAGGKIKSDGRSGLILYPGEVGK